MTDISLAIEAMMDEVNAPISSITDNLDVSHSAFYAWKRQNLESRRKEFDKRTPALVAVFHRHRRGYGDRRVAKELADEAISCGPKRVAKVLKKQDLRAIQPK